jgi:hypothetical protein
MSSFPGCKASLPPRVKTPLLNDTTCDQSSPVSGQDDRRPNAQRLQEVIRLLNSTRTAIEVVVTAPNAKLFADYVLGPIVRRERRGKNPTSDTEHLLVEMFRRLHLMPVLPHQGSFAKKMIDWWNSQPDFPAREYDWAHGYAKLIWTALKQAPKP